jgi:hypothetical protein
MSSYIYLLKNSSMGSVSYHQTFAGAFAASQSHVCSSINPTITMTIELTPPSEDVAFGESDEFSITQCMRVVRATLEE